MGKNRRCARGAKVVRLETAMRVNAGVVDMTLLSSIPGMKQVAWLLADPADPSRFQGYTKNLDPVGGPIRLVAKPIQEEE